MTQTTVVPNTSQAFIIQNGKPAPENQEIRPNTLKFQSLLLADASSDIDDRSKYLAEINQDPTREKFIESMRNKLIGRIERSDEKFSSKEIQDKYVKLAEEMVIDVKNDRIYDFLADYEDQRITVNYDATIFRDQRLSRGSLPEGVFKIYFQEALAHEMRHLTPTNHAIVDTGRIGAALSSSAHETSPTEIDANNFADILFNRKEGIISDY